MDINVITTINSVDFPSAFDDLAVVIDAFRREDIFAIRIVIQPRPPRYDVGEEGGVVLRSCEKDVVIFSREIFAGCTNIQSFSTTCLDANVECVFDEGVFHDAKRSLQRVSLCRSCLEGALPVGLFKGCSSLRELYLYNNAITHIDDDFLCDGVENLEVFCAFNNAIQKIDMGMLFRNTPRIKTIDVTGNAFDISTFVTSGYAASFPPGGNVFENGVWHTGGLPRSRDGEASGLEDE